EGVERALGGVGHRVAERVVGLARVQIVDVGRREERDLAALLALDGRTVGASAPGVFVGGASAARDCEDQRREQRATRSDTHEAIIGRMCSLFKKPAKREVCW